MMVRKSILKAVRQSKFKDIVKDKSTDDLTRQRIEGKITREQFNRRFNLILKKQKLK